MMEQRSEPLLPPFPSDLAHTAQSWDTRSPLCVGLVLDGAMFSLARALPSPASAEECSSLFDRFTGTTTQSDSSETCRPAVRLLAFSGRSRSWLDREIPEVSRFSCMLFLSVRGFSDYAEPTDRSRIFAIRRVAFPVGDAVGVSD